MIFLGFQVPHQCHTEELNHSISPAVPPLVHKPQDELSPPGDSDRSSAALSALPVTVGTPEPRARRPG